MGTYLLGLDLSAKHCKAHIFSREGRQLKFVSRGS